jgi:hypothetical protein
MSRSPGQEGTLRPGAGLPTSRFQREGPSEPLGPPATYAARNPLARAIPGGAGPTPRQQSGSSPAAVRQQSGSSPAAVRQQSGSSPAAPAQTQLRLAELLDGEHTASGAAVLSRELRAAREAALANAARPGDAVDALNESRGSSADFPDSRSPGQRRRCAWRRPPVAAPE